MRKRLTRFGWGAFMAVVLGSMAFGAQEATASLRAPAVGHCPQPCDPNSDLCKECCLSHGFEGGECTSGGACFCL